MSRAIVILCILNPSEYSQNVQLIRLNARKRRNLKKRQEINQSCNNIDSSFVRSGGRFAGWSSSCKIATGLFSITKIPRRNYRDSRMERRFIETPTKLRPFHDGMSCAILLAATAPFASSSSSAARARECATRHG